MPLPITWYIAKCKTACNQVEITLKVKKLSTYTWHTGNCLCQVHAAHGKQLSIRYNCNYTSCLHAQVLHDIWSYWQLLSCSSLSCSCSSRGGDLGGRGDHPLKKLGGGDRSAFIPQYLENVLQIYNVKTNKNEKEDETHVTRDRHTSIILFHCLD